LYRVETLPASIERFRQIGGEIHFAIFEDADGGADEALRAICEVVPQVDKEQLRAIGFREIDDKQFYGDRYDLITHSLLTDEWLNGTWARRTFREIGDCRPNMSGGIPEAGRGGQFAYAFAAPPYSLTATANEIQDLFDKIRQVILPPREDHQIFDWTDPALIKVSPFFVSGMEWWGIYLFTLYVPSYRRLTVAFASTTD
jgi:hypothetical protein